jgi:hypothetical protein
MAVLETLTFRLAPFAEEPAFLDADRRAQTDFAYQQGGLVRRTTARGEDGRWIVVQLWVSLTDADRAARRAPTDPAMQPFLELIDGESLRTERFHLLD